MMGGRTPEKRCSLKGLKARVCALWDDMPLMRTFFCYAASCVAVSVVVSIAIVFSLMLAYAALQSEEWEGRIDVNDVPYIYDEEADELVPAVAIEFDDGNRVTFLGSRSGALTMGAGVNVINAETGAPIGYATMDMVRDDATLRVYDWGGNYTTRDFESGDPYSPVIIDSADLASYDARERAERLPVDAEIGNLVAGNDDLIVSNIAYFIYRDNLAIETPLMMGLRIASAAAPFIVLGVFSVLFFRRFYRKRLGGPLSVFCDCANRVAAQDLDFTTPAVPGREFARLGEAFEKMRASLEASQRELWRTAEERRRLNAAFAHDLRTPVTVLAGTVEMAQLRAARGEAIGADALETIKTQVIRLERYAQAMSGIARLEDRKVEREIVEAGALAGALRAHAQGLIGAQRPDVALGVDTSGMAPDATLSVDRALVEEVLDNLLGNACTHADSRIALGLALDTAFGMLAVRVADDGPGFSPEALRRGCEAFFGEAKSAEHFGLGLSIVATLARLHGGAVVLENAPSSGAIVTVTIDVAPPEVA